MKKLLRRCRDYLFPVCWGCGAPLPWFRKHSFYLRSEEGYSKRDICAVCADVLERAKMQQKFKK